MTKYIDLLREHQQESEKMKADKQKKNADGSVEMKHNPYINQHASNSTLIENMEVLLEEPEDVIGKPHEKSDSLIESMEALLEEQEDGVGQQTLLAETKTELNKSALGLDDNYSELEAKLPSAQDMPTLNLTSSDFNAESWLQHISLTLTAMFSSVQLDEIIHIDRLNEPLNMLFNRIQSSPKTIDLLEFEINKQPQDAIDTTHNTDLVQKSIMLMLYSIKVGSQLKLQPLELLPCAVAAMLHHLGMAMVPPAIRQKSDKLNDDEFDQIKQASQKALSYLQHHQIHHEHLVQAIAQASERFDGSGPQGTLGHGMAWIARLITLLSMFEALIHFRPYRQRLLPRDAIREIVKKHKKEFDPEMLKALIESISLYPVGTYIQLNTGEIGQVTNIHAKFPLRPIVYINMDKYGHAITERKIDLKTQPNLMIQKCMYEEGLQELTEGKIS